MTEICATCAEFSLKESPRAAEGIGLCAVPWEPSINPHKDWNERPCVLYMRAPDMSKRMAWIRKQEAETNNETEGTR